MGSEVMRTPMASYMALAMAGITGCRAPSPHSFAPNGPSGSMDSMISVWTSGVSKVVGIL